MPGTAPEHASPSGGTAKTWGPEKSRPESQPAPAKPRSLWKGKGRNSGTREPTQSPSGLPMRPWGSSQAGEPGVGMVLPAWSRPQDHAAATAHSPRSCTRCRLLPWTVATPRCPTRSLQNTPPVRPPASACSYKVQPGLLGARPLPRPPIRPWFKMSAGA